jgi:hypothetical protein
MLHCPKGKSIKLYIKQANKYVSVMCVKDFQVKNINGMCYNIMKNLAGESEEKKKLLG